MYIDALRISCNHLTRQFRVFEVQMDRREFGFGRVDNFTINLYLVFG